MTGTNRPPALAGRQRAMGDRLRLLYISFNMPWRGGGTFYRLFGLARHLVRRGHQVTVLATAPSARWRFVEERIDGVRLALAPALLTGSLRTGWDPYEVARRCQWLNGRFRHGDTFDLIHGFESRPVVIHPALYARRRLGVPLCLDWCDWFGRGGFIAERPFHQRLLLNHLETFYEERFRRRATGTTVINDPLRRRAIALSVLPESIHCLPNGVDVDAFPVLDRDAARRELGLSRDLRYIGHLGQALPRDARLLVDAFARVHATRPDSRLLLIGRHKTDIAGLAAVPGAVLETGYVDDRQLRQYLAACDLLWLPLSDTLANRGRWPMKINDYMASGRAVISTPVGDLARLFRGGQPIGRLAAGSPGDFAQQTLTLLDDPAAAAEYGRNGRHLAETVYAWPLVTAELEAFYFRLLANPGPDRP